MKKGSGDLDFASSSSADTNEADAEASVVRSETSQKDSVPDPDPQPDEPVADEESGHPFPYFVRRNNVGDERDERIEVHLRKSVLRQESEFREALKRHLGDDGEVSKTDAREFALLYAFENPEAVAALMREEGYGLTD